MLMSANLSDSWLPPLIVWWYAGRFVLDSWADSISMPTNKHFQELSREVISVEGTQSLCISFSSLVCHAAQFFVSVLAQYDDRKKSSIGDYFLPTSPLVPFNYCFSFQTKSNPWIEFRKNLSKCLIWGALNAHNILTILCACGACGCVCLSLTGMAVFSIVW